MMPQVRILSRIRLGEIQARERNAHQHDIADRACVFPMYPTPYRRSSRSHSVRCTARLTECQGHLSQRRMRDADRETYPEINPRCRHRPRLSRASMWARIRPGVLVVADESRVEIFVRISQVGDGGFSGRLAIVRISLHEVTDPQHLPCALGSGMATPGSQPSLGSASSMGTLTWARVAHRCTVDRKFAGQARVPTAERTMSASPHRRHRKRTRDCSSTQKDTNSAKNS